MSTTDICHIGYQYISIRNDELAAVTRLLSVLQAETNRATCHIQFDNQHSFKYNI